MFLNNLIFLLKNLYVRTNARICFLLSYNITCSIFFVLQLVSFKLNFIIIIPVKSLYYQEAHMIFLCVFIMKGLIFLII